MIILIGGVSCTGKTLMAQKLLEKYHMPYMSIDHVKMGLIRGSRYCDFKATDGDDEIAEKLWPIVKGIIMTNIENDQHLILEGCYLPPEHLADFESPYAEQIISLNLIFSKNYIESHFETGIIKHLDQIEKRSRDDYMNVTDFIQKHKALKARSIKHNITYFEVVGDYERDLKQAYAWVDQRVSELKR